jgi:hypothetical protein
MKPLQHLVASKTAKFGTVNKGDAPSMKHWTRRTSPPHGSLYVRMARLKGQFPNSTKSKRRPGDLGLSSQLPDCVDGSIAKRDLAGVSQARRL